MTLTDKPMEKSETMEGKNDKFAQDIEKPLREARTHPL